MSFILRFHYDKCDRVVLAKIQTQFCKKLLNYELSGTLPVGDFRLIIHTFLLEWSTCFSRMYVFLCY